MFVFFSIVIAIVVGMQDYREQNGYTTRNKRWLATVEGVATFLNLMMYALVGSALVLYVLPKIGVMVQGHLWTIATEFSSAGTFVGTANFLMTVPIVVFLYMAITSALLPDCRSNFARVAWACGLALVTITSLHLVSLRADFVHVTDAGAVVGSVLLFAMMLAFIDVSQRAASQLSECFIWTCQLVGVGKSAALGEINALRQQIYLIQTTPVGGLSQSEFENGLNVLQAAKDWLKRAEFHASQRYWKSARHEASLGLERVEDFMATRRAAQAAAGPAK